MNDKGGKQAAAVAVAVEEFLGPKMAQSTGFGGAVVARFGGTPGVPVCP